MKKLLLVTSSLIALGAAAPAVAADLAARPYTKAPPMVAAVYDWTGFYIGANGGWGSSRNSWDAVPPNFGFGPEGSHDATVTTRMSTRSACSPVRLVMPSTTSCSTSRAVLL